MSRNNGPVLDNWTTKPVALTSLGPKYSGGRCRSSVDGSLWLYRMLPLSPVTDAPTDAARFESMEPLFRALSELSSLSVGSSKRRAMARSNYRDVHILAINIDTAFKMPEGHPLKIRLEQEYSYRTVDRRLVMFGVRLRDKVGGGSEKLADRIDAIAQFLADGIIPLSDFDEDFRRIDTLLNRCGLLHPSADDFRLANAWWNLGQTPDVPTLTHQDHMHVFHEPRSMRLAALVGEDNCEGIEFVPGQSAVTFASLSEFNFSFDNPHSSRAQWISKLFARGARAISIRAMVEPAGITGGEVRRQKSRYINDIEERRRQNKMDRPQQEAMLGMLAAIEEHYAKEDTNPTLVDTSIIVGMNGIHNLNEVDDKLPLTLVPMQLKQAGALAETWLCSPFRSNPNLHDIPIQNVVASGITGLNFVGDRTGALIGFTESDKQPAFLDPRAASREDDLPMMLVVGATGSGKSMTLMKMASDLSDMDVPGVIVDLKQKSDFAPGVLSHGGQVIELDALASADGILDPLRLTDDPKEGQSLALSVLAQINPWGSMMGDYEQPLKYALNYGLQHGATCTGQALLIAQRDLPRGSLPPDMIPKIIQCTESDPQVRAIIGMNPTTAPLSVSNGVTLIMAGNSSLDIPKDGHAENLSHRIALAMCRMLVFGSAFALTARGGGFIFLDEAWMFLQAGSDELKRLGRLARSQKVFPALFTQQVSDAMGADLEGYISRVMIGHISDAREARAACALAGLNPDDYVGRITASGKVGVSHQSEGVTDAQSLRPVKDENGNVVRGAIWYYRDLNRRCVPVEVVLSDEFIMLNSTNPDDQEKYRAYREQVKSVYRRRMGAQ